MRIFKRFIPVFPYQLRGILYDALSDMKHHFRGNPPQTAMINWTLPISAGTARYGMPRHWMPYRIKWCPAGRVSRSKDGDTGSIDCTGEMGWTRIVADKEVEFADECWQSTQRCLTGQIDCIHFHLIDYGCHGH